MVRGVIGSQNNEDIVCNSEVFQFHSEQNGETLENFAQRSVIICLEKKKDCYGFCVKKRLNKAKSRNK